MTRRIHRYFEVTENFTFPLDRQPNSSIVLDRSSLIDQDDDILARFGHGERKLRRGRRKRGRTRRHNSISSPNGDCLY